MFVRKKLGKNLIKFNFNQTNPLEIAEQVSKKTGGASLKLLKQTWRQMKSWTFSYFSHLFYEFFEIAQKCTKNPRLFWSIFLKELFRSIFSYVKSAIFLEKFFPQFGNEW
jgi:hypothetical protein